MALDRDAIRARLQAATPGPWKVCPDEATEGDLELVCQGTVDQHAGPICMHPLTSADAEFIAHAPTDVAALLDEVERLGQQLPGKHSRIFP